MNILKPIKNTEQLNKLQIFLKDKDYRYYILFLLGIETGIYLNELLPLKIADVRRMVRDQHEGVVENRGDISDSTIQMIYAYAFENNLTDDDFLFASPFRKNKGESRAICRAQAFKVFKQAGEAVGVEAFGPQTMRKTFAYQLYLKTGDIAKLMLLCGKTDVKRMLKFIDVDEKEYLNSH